MPEAKKHGYLITYLLFFVICILIFDGCKKDSVHNRTNLNNNEIGVLGHRGAGVAFYINYPINTMESINTAIEELGADGVEIDGQLTKDNQVILYHDTELQLMTSCSGTVSSHTGDELSHCVINSTFFNTPYTVFHLAALEEVFKKYSGYSPAPVFYIDIKPKYDTANFTSYAAYNLAFAQTLYALISKYGQQENTLLSSTDLEMLQQLKLLSPSLKLLVDIPGFDTAFQQASSLGIFGLTIKYTSINRDQIEKAHSNNLRVILWGVDTKEACDDAARLFPDYVETDNVLYMISLS